MSAGDTQSKVFSRRAVLIGAGLAFVKLIFTTRAEAEDSATDRFNYLSTNGNSNCTARFMNSIAALPATARLQGSCCGPMDKHRYTEQTQGLRKYRNVPEIPPDPYDIAASLAQTLMPHYDLVLTDNETFAYEYAMTNSAEKGPCCCQCWRWKVYGGLAKQLIRNRSFKGEQIVEVWNLSDGCGGGAEHQHG